MAAQLYEYRGWDIVSAMHWPVCYYVDKQLVLSLITTNINNKNQFSTLTTIYY